MCGRPDLPDPTQHGNGDRRDEPTGPIQRAEPVHGSGEGSQTPDPVAAPGGEWEHTVPVEDVAVEPVVQREEEQPLDQLAGITERLDSIDNALKDAAAQLRSRDGLIEELTSSLDAARREQTVGLLTPLAKKLVDISAKASDAASKDYSELPPERLHSQVQSEFDYLAELLGDALELIGFIDIEAREGDAFDARRHIGVDRIPTTDPAADKTIAKVLRPGYKYEHSRKAEFPARVSVYAYTAPEPEPTDPDSNQ